jgi:hypothetical protein
MTRRWLLLIGLALVPAAKADGLDFNTYLSIQRSMSEGEVLASAGPPDYIADLGFTPESLPIRTYSYLPTPAQPYATTVTFFGGRVSAIERSGKLTAPSQGRGLDFGTYLSIQRNMVEGEVLAIAGRPDLVAEQGFTLPEKTNAALRVRTYTYLATPEEPNTTTITFVGGRVQKVERRWRF